MCLILNCRDKFIKLHCHNKLNSSVLVIQAIDNNSNSFHGNTDVESQQFDRRVSPSTLSLVNIEFEQLGAVQK